MTEVFFEWLLDYACDLLNRFKVPRGNKTAWGFIKVEPYSGYVYAFRTPVLPRLSGTVQGGVMTERWHDGSWLGLQCSSGEHMVASSDGRDVRARAVHPRADTVGVPKEA